jgi:hypothetical protein
MDKIDYREWIFDCDVEATQPMKVFWLADSKDAVAVGAEIS